MFYNGTEKLDSSLLSTGQIKQLSLTRLIAFVNGSVPLLFDWTYHIKGQVFILKMTYHIYDLVQSDTKHYCHVVLNRKDGSAGLAVSKQVLSQFLVVIAICRKGMLE